MTNEPGLPTALLLSSDATTVLDALHLGLTGFELRHGDAGLPIVPTGIDPPSPRKGFAAAWSRTAGALYVIGGTDPMTSTARADAWRFSLNGGWTSVPLDPSHTPQNVVSATFCPADWRVWLLDQVGSGDPRLMRIDADTGMVSTDKPMHCLRHFDNLWLLTLEDARIVLVAQKGNKHRLALLSAQPFSPDATLRVEGAASGKGRIAAPPAIRFGMITLGIDKKLGPASHVIAPVVFTAQDLVQDWPGLDQCDQADENESDDEDDEPKKDTDP
jgi:hypothetical protein